MPPAKRTSSRRSLSPVRGIVVAAAVVAFSCVLGAVSETASAGPVRGKVSGHERLVPDVYAEAAKPDARRYTWREPSPTVRAEFRNLSGNPSRDICVAALASGPAPAPEPILVKITGGHTIPTNIVVSPGTRLSFENRDPFQHRLYAVNLATWKAETINPAARREWTAPNGQGRFEFRDELAPSVRLYVIVEPTVAEIAYPGRDGSFLMSTLASGEYTLQAYFNGKKVGRAITVTAQDKRLVEVKDTLQVGEGGDPK